MSEQDLNTEAAATADEQPSFSIDRVYTKDLSLEVPHAPEIFLLQEQPKIDIQVVTASTKLEENYYEGSLKVTTSAVMEDGRTLFLAEVTQAGIFTVQNIDEQDLAPLFGIACPNMLFPYAREAISSLVARSGLPPVLLAPINFEAMYLQHLNELAEQESEGATKQ